MNDLFSKIKLTLGQWLGVVGAVTVGILTLLLKSKQREIDTLKVENVDTKQKLERTPVDQEISELERKLQEGEKEYHEEVDPLINPNK